VHRKRFSRSATSYNNKEWLAVRMRTEEIQAACSETVTRWRDQLSIERRNDVMTAAKLISSVAQEAATAHEELTPQKLQRMAEAHIQASAYISSAVGEARREEERNGETYHGK
jgi:hypothetical protein